MSQNLELRFEPDTDGTGELSAFAQRGRFSGEGSAWFHINAIIEFCELLTSSFPLPQDKQLSLKGGYWKSGSNPPMLEDVLLGIQVYPVGTTGTLGVKVELLDGRYEGQRPESRARLCIELLTDYESIRVFGNSIVRLVRVPDTIATLHPNAA